jgi:hypothetical protein
MWKYFGLTKRAENAKPGGDPVAEKVDVLLAEMQQLRETAATFTLKSLPPRGEADPMQGLDRKEIHFVNTALTEMVHAGLDVGFLGKHGKVFFFASRDPTSATYRTLESVATQHGQLFRLVSS